MPPRSISKETALLFALLCTIAFVSNNGAAAENRSTGKPKNQATAAPRLSLERIFKDKEFKTEEFSATWLEDHPGYTYLEEVAGNPMAEEESAKEDEDKDKVQEIWRAIPGEDEPSLLVAASALLPEGEKKPLAIESYSFSKDLDRVLLYTNSKRVWRKNTRGDYWFLERSTGKLHRLGGDAPASSLMFAKFSPDATRVAYVRERNVYVEDLADHSIRPLTSTRNGHIINGTFDWVYEEELQVRDGFRWSPDGKSIAYWQFDTTGVPEYTLVDHVTELYPKLKSFAYPKVGQKNSACRVGVVSTAGGETRWLEIPGDPREHYLARMDWAENSEELLIQQFNRTQDENRLILANATSGALSTIHVERDEAWVDAHKDLHWIRNGSHFTWLSERDGWRHLYLVSRDGKSQECLTPGDYDVIDIVSVTDEAIDFLASPGNPATRYLYRVNTDGTSLTRLTPKTEDRGSHYYDISPDGAHAITTSSNLETPPVTTLVTLPGHQTLAVLEANEDLSKKWSALDRPAVEFFYVDIGEEENLHARAFLPPGFDPSKKYPLLIYVYGEPAGQVVRDSWPSNTQLWHFMLAQQGYVVVSVDNRGTKAPRGRAWRKAAHRRIGIMAPRQQAAAVRRILSERPYLDPARVGTWGWSGGGSMSLNAIFKYPDLYHTAIAVASVPDQLAYDTIYQERYMGLPKDNADNFREGSPIHFAHQLEGDLLIVHGANDDNCHYQTFEKLVDKLVEHNKPFTMMTYPRGTHSIKEGKNTTLHLYSLMTRFLHEHLPVKP